MPKPDFSLEFCDRYLRGLTLIPPQFIVLKRKKKKSLARSSVCVADIPCGVLQELGGNVTRQGFKMRKYMSIAAKQVQLAIE